MYLDRKTVCGLLRISVRASYRAWNRMRPRHHMVSSADVVAMLNASARAGQISVSDVGAIPETLTAEEVSAATGYPSRRLVLATRHRINPLPHWRINSHVVRFHLPTVQKWLEGV